MYVYVYVCLYPWIYIYIYTHIYAYMGSKEGGNIHPQYIYHPLLFIPKVDEYPKCQQGWEKKQRPRSQKLEVVLENWVSFMSHANQNPNKKKQRKGTYLVLLCFCACIHIKTLTWVIKAYMTLKAGGRQDWVFKNRIP